MGPRGVGVGVLRFWRERREEERGGMWNVGVEGIGIDGGGVFWDLAVQFGFFFWSLVLLLPFVELSCSVLIS